MCKKRPESSCFSQCYSARLIINDDITFQHLILSLQNYTSKLLHVNEDLIFILSTKSFFPAKHEFIFKTKSSSQSVPAREKMIFTQMCKFHKTCYNLKYHYQRTYYCDFHIFLSDEQLIMVDHLLLRESCFRLTTQKMANNFMMTLKEGNPKLTWINHKIFSPVLVQLKM